MQDINKSKKNTKITKSKVSKKSRKKNYVIKSRAIKTEDIKVIPKRKKSFKNRKKLLVDKKSLNTKLSIPVIKESVNPTTIDTNQFKLHDKLNPEIWDSEDKINPELREILLKNAIEFIRFAKLENFDFKDILLTGSLANYNYNPYSDLDVHILFDFSLISDNIDFVREYLDSKKDLWKLKYAITIKNHDVELYVQDVNESYISTGVYSLFYNKWLIKPVSRIISIDTNAIQKKSADIMDDIDEIELNIGNIPDNYLIAEIRALKDKIKKFRDSGLHKNGEYSTENLVFKTLRNSGYLGKLGELKDKLMTKELSLQPVGLNEDHIPIRYIITQNQYKFLLEYKKR